MLHAVLQFRLTLVLAVCLLAGCLYPIESVPLSEVHWGDTLIHVCIFFVLSTSAWIEVSLARISSKRQWIVAMTTMLAYGGIVELLQEYFTTSRSGEWLDFTADAIGVGLAAAVFHLGIARLLTHLTLTRP